MKTKRRWISSLIAMALIMCLAISLVGCTGNDSEKKPADKTIDVYSSAAITALSDTGVVANVPADLETDKEVGIFYFIWMGTGGSPGKNVNCTNLLKNIDLTGKTGITLDEWIAAGGAGKGNWHWWGEPLFGYYNTLDEWVISRHVEMLTDAGIDYIFLDLTNGVLEGYIQRINLIFQVFDKYYQQGFDVPKIAMMSYEDGTGTLDRLYMQFYKKNAETYSHLFYHWNGHEKPVIFDNISGYNESATGQMDTEEKMKAYKEGITDFFEIRDLAFPHETKFGGDPGTSLIYLDFRNNPEPIVDEADGGYSFCNVSVSEICVTNAASAQWFKDTGDRSRNWDGTSNRHWEGEEDAYLYGYNFARQFEYAIEKDVDMIFVTGWNEWIAQLQVGSNDNISLIDNADINNSRDIEPMKGGFGDNYYIQLCKYISEFKYGTIGVGKTSSLTIDVNGDFTQWDKEGIWSAEDYTEENKERNFASAYDNSITYQVAAALNDIKTTKIASDAENIYFYLETVADLDLTGEVPLTLFLKTGAAGGWAGYDHRILLASDKALIQKANGKDAWTDAGNIDIKVSGNKLMMAVSKAALGITGELNLEFKWAEGYIQNDGIWTFYSQGDCAPYGRFNYAYKAD